MTRCFVLILLLATCITTSNAQVFRKHYISIGDGLGSAEQWRNVLGDHTHEYMRQGIPFRLSGPVFVTYRHAIDEWVSVGITAGFDNSTGHITRRHRLENGFGSLGSYHRQSCTIATELQVVYYSGNEGAFYSFAGAGYSFSNVSVDYLDKDYAEISKWAPDLLGDDPRVINDNRFAHQVTLFGYRTNTRLSVFGEAGFGYKGLLHFGLGYEW